MYKLNELVVSTANTGKQYLNISGKRRFLHSLKSENEYFISVEKGIKTFEIRKNDRFFESGDVVVFTNKLTDEISDVYEITYVSNYAQKFNYVVFSIMPLKVEVSRIANDEEEGERK